MFGQEQSTPVYIPGRQLSLGSHYQESSEVVVENGYPLVEISSNFNLTTVLTGTSNLESLVGYSLQLPSRNVLGQVLLK